MLRRVLARLASGLCAGTLIALGGGVFLGCRGAGDDPIWQIAGAVFFSVALLCICYRSYALYTGRVGFLIEKHDREAVSVLLLGLVGNLVAALLWGLAVRYAIPTAGTTAEVLAAVKLTQSFPQTLIRATLCGLLMYVAVVIYRDNRSIVAILFCVPTFILAGFEHSIADFFYFAAAGEFSGRMWLFTMAALLGNSLGAWLLPLLSRVGGKQS